MMTAQTLSRRGGATLLRRRIRRDERGSTMAAVLMVLMVVTVIGVASVQLAQHSNDISSVDRERTQSVSAAEAGVTSAIDRIEVAATCDATVTPFAELYDGTRMLGKYRTRIDPEAGTSCGDTPRRVIHSWGYAPTGGTRGLRHLEVTVELIPQAGFPFTLFAEGSTGTIYVKNNGTVVGDVYSETIDQTKNNVFVDDIITPGSITTLNNAAYTGTLWAGGDVFVGENSTIGQSVIAAGSTSAGNVTLQNNTHVGGDVLRKGTLTQGSGVVVDGSVPPANPNLPAPPVLTKPTFNPDAVAYDFQGSAAQVNAWLNTNKDNLQGEVRATDGNLVIFPDNVTVTGPLTVVSDGSGKVRMGQTMSASGGPHVVVVVAMSPSTSAIEIPKTLTIASALHTLLFARGGVDMKNAVSMTGAVYADFIDIKNTFTINGSEILKTLAPTGFTWTFGSSSAYAAVPTLWREIVPGEPPP